MKKRPTNYKVREESVTLAMGYLIGIKRTNSGIIDTDNARKGAEEEFSLTEIESALAFDGYNKYFKTNDVQSTFEETETIEI